MKKKIEEIFEYPEILDKAKEISNLNQIQKFKSDYPLFPIEELLTIIKLQMKFGRKIDNADKMLLTQKGGEQASSKIMAKFHAQKLQKYDTVADICCGLGIDLIEIAKKSKKVFAIELDEKTIRFARHNCSSVNLSNISFLHIDGNDFDEKVDAIYIDPDRRPKGKRTADIEIMSPSMNDILKMQRITKNILIKLSPITDYRKLEISVNHSFEFVSENGILKEILLCLGNFAHEYKCKATLLPQNITLNNLSPKCKQIISIQNYIFEPDSAIIRAGLVEQIAHQIKYDFIDENIAILTSDKLAVSGFGKFYAVQESMSYNEKKLKRKLREDGIGNLIIKTRGFPITAENFRKKFKLKGKKEQIILIVRLEKKHQIMFLSRI